MAMKVIVITGASSGIGEAAALQLARKGTRLCLIARREDELDRVRKRVEARGGAASVYPLDLNDPAAIDACCAKIVSEHKRVDVLINNAGRSIRRTIKESLDRDHDFERVMQLNYFAPVRMTLRLLPQFLKQRRGHIINVSSVLGFLPAPRFAAHVASKSALDAFSRSIAAELEDDNIRLLELVLDLDDEQGPATARAISAAFPSVKVVAFSADGQTMRVFPPFHRGESYAMALSTQGLLETVSST